MPSWIKYKYTGLSVWKSSSLHFTHISNRYFCPNGKRKQPEHFQCEKQIWFWFHQKSFLHARTLFSSMLNVLCYESSLITDRDLLGKTPQTELSYSRETLRIFLSNIRQGKSPNFLTALWLFLFCFVSMWAHVATECHLSAALLSLVLLHFGQITCVWGVVVCITR